MMPDRPPRHPVRSIVTILIALAAFVGAMGVDNGISTTGPSGRIVLTGSLRAAEAERFTVPVTSSWQQTLKWLIPEGEPVESGDSIALFDPAGAEDQLLNTEEALISEVQKRASEEAQGRLQRMDLELALKRAEVEHRKAQLDAAIPQDVLDGVDYRQRQLDMATRKVTFEQAELELLNHDASMRSTLAEIDIEIAELRTDCSRMEEEVDSLNLRATRSGIVVHAEHPWWGRKVVVGDRLRATFPVAHIPNLETLEVEAWACETDAVHLSPGQRLSMRLDSFPDRLFTGRVTSVAVAGERRASWGRAPYFRVLIALDGLDLKIMKPGMSARCEIEAEAVEDEDRS